MSVLEEQILDIALEEIFKEPHLDVTESVLEAWAREQEPQASSRPTDGSPTIPGEGAGGEPRRILLWVGAAAATVIALLILRWTGLLGGGSAEEGLLLAKAEEDVLTLRASDAEPRTTREIQDGATVVAPPHTWAGFVAVDGTVLALESESAAQLVSGTDGPEMRLLLGEARIEHPGRSSFTLATANGRLRFGSRAVAEVSVVPLDRGVDPMFMQTVRILLQAPLVGGALVSVLILEGTVPMDVEGETRVLAAGDRVTVTPAGVQEMPQPGPEHALLKKRVGKWNAANRMRMTPEQPWMETKGTETVKLICGGFWQVATYESTFMGAPFSGTMQLGYDLTKKKYVSSWVDSFSSHLAVGEGTYDEKTRTLTMWSEQFDPIRDKKVKSRTTTEFVNDDKTIMRMYHPSDAGEFISMEITYNRNKK